MRNFEGDEGCSRRDIRRHDRRCPRWSGLDDQIDLLADEHVGVAKRGFGIVPIVDGDELDAFGRRGSFDADGYLT